jgi:hypothetical protein
LNSTWGQHNHYCHTIDIIITHNRHTTAAIVINLSQNSSRCNRKVYTAYQGGLNLIHDNISTIFCF